ncbi:MAG: hypothetical protein K2Y37_14420 [Pirellulales bacterium]|nr:hypothetical protein [Pirellulales bacterium]
MSNSKPEALIAPTPPRPCCPVCGKATYSSTGIHPQCAASRAAVVIDERAKARREAEAKAAAPRNMWQKKCPKCRREVAARRAVCDCGYAFPGVKKK